jgi:hypothetical protein
VSKIEQAARYRDRADELRRNADGFCPENRDMILKMAGNYDAISRELQESDFASRIKA